MRILQIIICLFSISMAKEINGFAPTNIGSQWTYSDYYQSTKLTTWESVQNSDTIVIQIKQHSKIGNDSLILLQIYQNGTHIATNLSGGSGSAYTIAETYFDTVIIRNDSLFKSAGYRCPVFPFWKFHTINTDSFYLDSTGGQKLYCYEDRSNGSKYYYCQSIGLYTYSAILLSPDHIQESYEIIKLISFKPQFITVQKMYERLNNTGYVSHYKSVPILEPKDLFGKQSYDLYGKLITHANKCGAGFYIISKER